MTSRLQKFTIGLILFQILFWTLIPMVAHHAPPLDATEMYGWSLSFQWGFYKHPPMPPWVVAIVQAIVGKNMASLFLCSSLVIAGSYWCVAWLSEKFLPEKEAIVALFFYALTIYCNIWSTDFNHNQMQMPFWALSLVCLYQTLTQGSIKWTILLGLVMGLNTLSKYTSALIVPSAVLLLILSPHWRKQLNTKMVFVATLTFFIVFFPHLQWLYKHEFAPLLYVNERFDEMQDSNHFLDILDYVGNILLANSILVLFSIYVFLKWPVGHALQSGHGFQSKSHQWFLWIMGLGPILISITLGLFVPLYSRWATPMLPMLPIVVGVLLRGRFQKVFHRKFFVMFCLIQVLLGLVYIYKDHLNHSRSGRGNYPAPEIATEINRAWDLKYPNKPMRIVSGGEWEAGFISLFSKQKVYVYTHADSRDAPWISEADAHKCGMVMALPSPEQLARFPDAQVQEPLRIPASKEYEQVTFSWAILPPEGECTLK